MFQFLFPLILMLFVNILIFLFFKIKRQQLLIFSKRNLTDGRSACPAVFAFFACLPQARRPDVFYGISGERLVRQPLPQQYDYSMRIILRAIFQPQKRSIWNKKFQSIGFSRAYFFLSGFIFFELLLRF